MAQQARLLAEGRRDPQLDEYIRECSELELEVLSSIQRSGGRAPPVLPVASASKVNTIESREPPKVQTPRDKVRPVASSSSGASAVRSEALAKRQSPGDKVRPVSSGMPAINNPLVERPP